MVTLGSESAHDISGKKRIAQVSAVQATHATECFDMTEFAPQSARETKILAISIKKLLRLSTESWKLLPYFTENAIIAPRA